MTARALVDRGARPVLAARSADRLNRLAAELGGLETRVADIATVATVDALVERGGLEPRVADIATVATVDALVERGDVLISTVGPFARMGEPAVGAAVRAG